MRNQGWTQAGKLIRDDELYLDGEVLRVKDHITGEIRDPTEPETKQFYLKPPRDPLVEIDKLKADYATLKNKVDILEKK